VLSGVRLLTKNGVRRAPTHITSWTIAITNGVNWRAIRAALFRDPHVTKFN
jgi:hypothetical protein